MKDALSVAEFSGTPRSRYSAFAADCVSLSYNAVTLSPRSWKTPADFKIEQLRMYLSALALQCIKIILGLFVNSVHTNLDVK